LSKDFISSHKHSLQTLKIKALEKIMKVYMCLVHSTVIGENAQAVISLAPLSILCYISLPKEPS